MGNKSTFLSYALKGECIFLQWLVKNPVLLRELERNTMLLEIITPVSKRNELIFWTRFIRYFTRVPESRNSCPTRMIDECFWDNFCTTSPKARALVKPLVTIPTDDGGYDRELCFHNGLLNLFIYLDLSRPAASVPTIVSFYHSGKLVATKSGDWLSPECHRDLKDFWYQYFLDD